MSNGWKTSRANLDNMNKPNQPLMNVKRFWNKYNKVIIPLKVPLQIQNARNARSNDGSVLEYGLDYHLRNFKAALEKGLPGDPRFPERDNEYIEEQAKQYDLMLQWLEDFKSKFGQYDQAQATID